MVARGANIDVNGGFDGFKGGVIGQMAFLMLGFYGVVGGTAINVMTIHTNTHNSIPRWIAKGGTIVHPFDVNLA